MVGQKNLMSIINSFDVSKFPSVIMLLGKQGSGRRTLISDIIGPKLNMSIEDITDKITYENISDLYISSTPRLYYIDTHKYKLNKYNSLLKVLEDPPINAKFILLVDNINSVIPTIYSRCLVLSMDQYSDEELAKFSSNTKLIKYVKEPGQLLKYSNVNIDDLESFVGDVLARCKSTTLGNLFTIATKIDWDDNDSSKINLDLFCKILVGVSFDAFCTKHINLNQQQAIWEFINSDRTRGQFDKFLMGIKFG